MLTSHSHRWHLRQNWHLWEWGVASTWLCCTFPDTLSRFDSCLRWHVWALWSLSDAHFKDPMCEYKRLLCSYVKKKKTQRVIWQTVALRVSKRRLDKCPGPLRRVSLFTCYCIHVHQWLLCAPLTCAETIMSSRKDNSLSIQKFNIWSEKEEPQSASSSSG